MGLWVILWMMGHHLLWFYDPYNLYLHWEQGFLYGFINHQSSPLKGPEKYEFVSWHDEMPNILKYDPYNLYPHFIGVLSTRSPLKGPEKSYDTTTGLTDEAQGYHLLPLTPTGDVVKFDPCRSSAVLEKRPVGVGFLVGFLDFGWSKIARFFSDFGPRMYIYIYSWNSFMI